MGGREELEGLPMRLPWRVEQQGQRDEPLAKEVREDALRTLLSPLEVREDALTQDRVIVRGRKGEWSKEGAGGESGGGRGPAVSEVTGRALR